MNKRSPHTPETRSKISAGNAGKTVSPETKLKMSLAKLGKPVLPSQLEGLAKGTQTRRLRVSVNGLVYESIAAAGDALGVSHEVTRRRVHSERDIYADWKLVE